MVTAAGIAIVALAGLLALLYLRQEALIFFPQTLRADYDFGLPGVDEVRVPVDGATLSALHLTLPQPRGVVFFLHGNAGNLADWFVDTPFYWATNVDVFMIDYRGYGKSTGRIESEDQLHQDVAVAWRHIAARYQGQRKIIYGRSLGTALAARLAAQVQPDLTVLVSPYWSLAELARLHYPILPTSLLRYPLKTFEDIGRIEGAVLMIHGDRDALIPFDHSVRLQALARHSELVRIEGGGHNDLQEFDSYTRAIADALGRIH
ncbi:MAG TPA: alpha/beta fold hydrolase [Burkholderiaceae bacterium]|nr:alpha/beta fold hydrolase [Burkholderiaceae bacterium]